MNIQKHSRSLSTTRLCIIQNLDSLLLNISAATPRNFVLRLSKSSSTTAVSSGVDPSSVEMLSRGVALEILLVEGREDWERWRIWLVGRGEVDAGFERELMTRARARCRSRRSKEMGVLRVLV